MNVLQQESITSVTISMNRSQADDVQINQTPTDIKVKLTGESIL